MKTATTLLISSLAVTAQAAPSGSWGWGWGGPKSWGHGGASKPPSDQVLRGMPIVRNGTILTLNGQQYTSTGANVYWLGLDENVIPPAGQPFYAPYNASFPTFGRITEAMNTVRTMGGRTIRSQTLGISVGNPLSLWPTLTTRNTRAFDTIDWAVYQAREHGLRLQVPLVDNYDWYHGGKFVFLRWFGFNASREYATASDIMQFYTNQTVIDCFKEYITYLLTHKNPFTGLTYAEDPTIAVIETGNELSGPIFGDKYVPNAWTQQIARHVKSLGPAKLIMDGTYGVNASHFAVPEIDMFTDHFYPLNITKLGAGIAAVEGADRVYTAGEYDWAGLSGGDSLPAFLAVIEARQTLPKPTVSGDQFWSLFMHNVPDCRVYVNHNDGFTLQYGNPDNTPMATRNIEIIRQHAFAMMGQNVPLATPALECPGPLYQAGV